MKKLNNLSIDSFFYGAIATISFDTNLSNYKFDEIEDIKDYEILDSDEIEEYLKQIEKGE